MDAEEKKHRKKVDAWAKREKARKAKDQEKTLEKKLRLAIKKMGGQALKFVSPGRKGVLDRIVLMPNAKAYFAEIKTEGEDLSDLQKVFQKEVQALGFTTVKIDTERALNTFLLFVHEDTFRPQRIVEGL